jgi:hypothetical protein
MIDSIRLFPVDIYRIIELCTVENMCLAELREDAQFKKMPAGGVRDYIDRLIKIAAGKAEKIKSESPGSKLSLSDICRSKGVSVNLIDGSRAQAGGRFRAEIYYDEKIINIMKRSIDQMYDALKNINFGENDRFVSVDNIKDMHIAHELYHLIEFTDGEYTPDLLPPVTSVKIFGFERRSGVSKASEAAAHIFCMRLLDIPFHPKMLDYLCLLSAGEVTRERLIEFLGNLKRFMT